MVNSDRNTIRVVERLNLVNSKNYTQQPTKHMPPILDR